MTHDISLDHIDVQCPKMHSFSQTPWKVHSELQPIPEISVLMPNNLQVHRQVLFSNARLSGETKDPFYKLL